MDQLNNTSTNENNNMFLSAYELERMKNIRENNLVLIHLGLAKPPEEKCPQTKQPRKVADFSERRVSPRVKSKPFPNQSALLIVKRKPVKPLLSNKPLLFNLFKQGFTRQHMEQANYPYHMVKEFHLLSIKRARMRVPSIHRTCDENSIIMAAAITTVPDTKLTLDLKILQLYLQAYSHDFNPSPHTLSQYTLIKRNVKQPMVVCPHCNNNVTLTTNGTSRFHTCNV